LYYNTETESIFTATKMVIVAKVKVVKELLDKFVLAGIKNV